ncbi:hypothetical protein DFA_09697 [Cavenderia fasciculata]|uniref:Uncharacterized protein n=1 Tax=Cavenderia fasciculata TaxID=261658 RepID=F4Q8C5_CACFS|nr:uncharacterized protein DFA_09697 [Cavenderia fasciculata]EGG16025.1 hypothetical protein DFA_09697 [Cavenderia fasciculata]|eukprot:XP_004352350.1 hypothetical protein DFA_09697 [Cavenderia fasciculata]
MFNIELRRHQEYDRYDKIIDGKNFKYITTINKHPINDNELDTVVKIESTECCSGINGSDDMID